MPWNTMKRIDRLFEPKTMENQDLLQLTRELERAFRGPFRVAILAGLKAAGFEDCGFVGQMRILADACLARAGKEGREKLLPWLMESGDDFRLSIAVLALETVFRADPEARAENLHRVFERRGRMSGALVAMALDVWHYECGEREWSRMTSFGGWGAKLSKMAQAAGVFRKKEPNLLDNPPCAL